MSEHTAISWCADGSLTVEGAGPNGPHERTKMEQSSQAVEGPLDGRVVPQRLWIVRVVREAYVLAADEEEAREARADMERWEDDPTVTVEPWAGRELEGWDDRCFVYSRGDKDVSLPEAKRLDPAPEVCGNCETALPEGCGGLFKDDGEQCRLNLRHNVRAETQPTAAQEREDGTV